MSKSSQKQHKQSHERPETHNRHQPNEDQVDEASQESFPASDSPGWSASTDVHKNPKKDQGQCQASKDNQ